MQSFWQQIQDLRFKINAREILFDKALENQNLNTTTYNFCSEKCNEIAFYQKFY